MRTTIFVFILIFATCQCQTSVCPSKEAIKPCICTLGRDSKPWMSCKGLTSADELRESVKGMQGFKFSTFYIEDSDIGILPADIFRNIDIQILSIQFTNLTSLSENVNRPPFLGLENSLESIEIRDSFVEENAPLTKFSISHLKKVYFVQLEGNIIPVIGNDWFESGPYGLRELYLFDTSVTKIGSHAFEALENIKKLSITGGKFSEIARTMFPKPALFLEVLDLSNNALRTLPKDMFTQMPALEEVFLDNNVLTSLNEVTWSPVWSQINFAHFYGNPIKCDQDLKWVYKYRLPESFQGHCSSPPELTGRSLSNLTLADFS
ncbi:Leucine-rich repeat and fibronectin type-III domain-containing protein 4, partial [Stegodyphus mimosarum]